MPSSVQGLYAITDSASPGVERLLATLEPVLSAGVRVLQYRDKSDDTPRRRREAEALAAVCRRHGVVFIINDDIELAAWCGADGVHLGRDDGSIAEARRRLGSSTLVGASCYASLDRAEQMRRAGADYLAFGAVYPSSTKPSAARADLALLRRARERFSLPLVAIGGIDPTNAAEVVATGVDAIAVIQGLFGQPDPVGAAEKMSALFAGDGGQD